MKIEVEQIPSEYSFRVTQECRLGQYDLVIIQPPNFEGWEDDWDVILAEKPF